MRRVTPERCLRVRLLLDIEGERYLATGGRDETPMGTPAPSTWFDCPSCHGTGRSGNCGRCDGTGLLLADPYTAQYDLHDTVGGVSISERETMEPYEIDRVLERIAEDIATRNGNLAAIKAKDEPHHWRQLHLNLNLLRDGTETHRALYRAVVALHWPDSVIKWGKADPFDFGISKLPHSIADEANTRTRLLEELAVRFLAARMTGPIPLPSAAENTVQLMRKVWVDELRAKGLGRREIARALGVSVRAVA